jgi:hypothetical protein
MKKLAGAFICGFLLLAITHCGSDNDKSKKTGPVVRYVPTPTPVPPPAPGFPNNGFNAPVLPKSPWPTTPLPPLGATQSYSYEFVENGVSTGKHTFFSLERYCAGLKSRSLNNEAAYSLRKAAYDARCAAYGLFREIP